MADALRALVWGNRAPRFSELLDPAVPSAENGDEIAAAVLKRAGMIPKHSKQEAQHAQ